MVIIKEFKMPVSCSDCPICYDTMECPIGPGLFDTMIPEDDVIKWYLENPGWFLSKRHLRCPLKELQFDFEKFDMQTVIAQKFNENMKVNALAIESYIESVQQSINTLKGGAE